MKARLVALGPHKEESLATSAGPQSPEGAQATPSEASGLTVARPTIAPGRQALAQFGTTACTGPLTSLKELLLEIPDVGEDRDFERLADRGRSIEL